jgi:hypothetical protein
MVEGRALIGTEVRPGLYAVVGAIAVLTACHVTVVRCSRRSER